MSDFKDFSKKATKDSEAANEVQSNEHTEVSTPTKPNPDVTPVPDADQKDKGVQPDHNTSKPSWN